MSQSWTSAVQYLSGLISRFYLALQKSLQARFQNLYNAIQVIIPNPSSVPPFIPLPGAPQTLQYQRVGYAWRDFYNKSVLNQVLQRFVPQALIAVDVEPLIGAAVHYGIQTRTGVSDPQPYVHQAEAIAKALYALNELRKWLYSGTQPNAVIQKPFDVLALLAPTASGKTEVLEAIAIQVAIDGKKAGFEATKVLMVYPMKEFMKDHIKRFVNELAYLNSQRAAQSLPPVTIGLLNEDTPKMDSSDNEVDNLVQILFPNLTCPQCGGRIWWSRGQHDVEVQCSKGHRFDFIRVTRDALREYPPDILLITPDELNIIMRELGRSSYVKVFGIDSQVKGLPLIVVMDEPHLYSGVLGANVSLIIRELRNTIREVAQWKYGISYEPFILVSSATMPNVSTFLAKLFIVDSSRIEIVSLQQQQQVLQSTKGLIALLPSPAWGLRNAQVEIIPLVAALLPPDKRRIIVFVDSVERADRIVYLVRDYISRPTGFWKEYDVCNNVGTIFDPSVCPSGNPDSDFMKIEALTAKMDKAIRIRVAEDFRAGKINVIVATSALEVGVDIGDVDIAILLSLPPTPINFEQRVGRIGRRGQPSLVIVIGDESSGVDTYYLSDMQRLINYITGARNYEIPLNPANPYAIRAYIGNFTSSLLWRIPTLKGRRSYQHRVNTYIGLAINLPINVFQRTVSPRLSIVQSYLQSVKNALSSQLMLFVNAVSKVLRSAGIAPIRFKAREWHQISREWSRSLGTYGLLGMSTPIDNIRSLGREVELRFEIGRGKELFKLSDDALLAISTYSISRLPDFDPRRYVFEGELEPDRRLRGVVTLKSVQLDTNRIEKMPFELVGGTYIPLLPTRNLQSFRDSLDKLLQFLTLLKDVGQQIYVKPVPSNVFRERVRCLEEALQNYVGNVLSNVIASFTQTGRLDTDKLKIANPEVLIFRPLEPLCIVDRNGQLRCYDRAYKKHLANAKQYLFYYEVDPQTRFLSKIGVARSSKRSGRISLTLMKPIRVTRPIVYDVWLRDLLIPTPQGTTTYKNTMSRSGIEISNVVVTRPLTFATVLDEKPMDVKGGRNSVEVMLETVEVFYANIGFTMSAPVPGSRSKILKPKFIDRKDEPGMIAEKFETYSVKISIDWDTWLKTAVSNTPQFLDSLVQDLKTVGVDVSKLSRPLHDLFAITVSHSLAHVILNFHPLYTGGDRKDLNEVLVVETVNGGIRRANIYLFDTVAGGNGVSELLYEYLGGILSDAVNVMIDRHIKCSSPSRSRERFFGEPGDIILAGWPRCSYGNVALSRLWLLRFLAMHSNTDLNTWVNRRKSGANIAVTFP